jgi:hypothetical protein
MKGSTFFIVFVKSDKCNIDRACVIKGGCANCASYTFASDKTQFTQAALRDEIIKKIPTLKTLYLVKLKGNDEIERELIAHFTTKRIDVPNDTVFEATTF